MSSEAEDWIATADPELVALMRRMRHHSKVKWEAEDYVEDGEFGPDGDGRVEVPTLEECEALGSALIEQPTEDAFDAMLEDREPGPHPDGVHHVIAIDVDVPSWWVPSSTEGHAHLYVDLPVPEEALWEWLDACVKIGLVEEGYVNACRSRGMTSLRAPWVRKGAEPSTQDQVSLEQARVDSQHGDGPESEDAF